jgi:hypothetical protein
MYQHQQSLIIHSSAEARPVVLGSRKRMAGMSCAQPGWLAGAGPVCRQAACTQQEATNHGTAVVHDHDETTCRLFKECSGHAKPLFGVSEAVSAESEL